jgi:FkbM family methyltransferase
MAAPIFKLLKRATHPARRAIAIAISPSSASYSAAGEDLLAWSWLSKPGRDPAEICYLDIGAAHPTALSNTFLLYTRGASGVLVEPDPDQAARLRSIRPRDIVVEAGVAFDGSTRLTLTKTTNPMFNSFSRERAMKVVEQSQSWLPSQRQQIAGCIEAKMIPANDLLVTHFSGRQLDFLSIDAEGADFEILKSIDLARFSPRLICIEAQASIDEHLQVLGERYRLIFRSADNLMFSGL